MTNHMDTVSVRQWGNSQGIRIPQAILKKLDINLSDELTIEVEDRAIVLRKKFRHKSLEERIAEYDGAIEVMDYDWGEPVGKEML